MDDHVLEAVTKLDLGVPHLSTFACAPVEELENVDAASISTSAEPLDSIEVLQEELWSFPACDEEGNLDAIFTSREIFHEKNNHEPPQVYVSEECARKINAASPAHDDQDLSNQAPYRCIQDDKALNCSLLLGLGRESRLYRFSQQDQTFYPSNKDARISGIEDDAVSIQIASLKACGSKLRKLKNCINAVLTAGRSCPALIALVTKMTYIITDMDAQITTLSTNAHTIPQLESLFERPCFVVFYLSNLLDNARDATSDQQVLSTVFDSVVALECTEPWTRPLMLQLFASASLFWLESVSVWLRLNLGSKFPYQGHDRYPEYIKATELVCKSGDNGETAEIVYDLDYTLIPKFISREDAETIFETGKNLCLLANHEPNHPLVTPHSNSVVPSLNLEWGFSWEDIENIRAGAKRYKECCWHIEKEFESSDGIRMSVDQTIEGPIQGEFSKGSLSEYSAKAQIAASNFAIQQPWLGSKEGHGGRSLGIPSSNFNEAAWLSEISSTPPLTLVPSLSLNPIIIAQACVVNRTCVRLLFRKHSLRSYLSLLYNFALLGDGGFSCRLSQALFDPEFQSIGRRDGQSHTGSTRLTIGSRAIWPSASSEIRLVLIDILEESYSTWTQGKETMFRKYLPGDLSFSLRDMSEEDLLKCMNPDSLEALDFLQLDFKPPSPLDAVISQASLVNYDAAFKLLLRVARMIFVVNQLWRDIGLRSSRNVACLPIRSSCLETRFSVEGRNFVSVLSQKFFDGIRTKWNNLQHRLDKAEATLDDDNNESLLNLRNLHDQTLDDMMFSLMLRRKQAPLLQLVEEVFGLILQFARHVRLQKMPFTAVENVDRTGELEKMYKKFRERVRAFINLCRGFSKQETQGTANKGFSSLQEDLKEDQATLMDQLLLALEMNDYYTR